MEHRVPFIAAIISGVITTVAIGLFVQQYLYLTIAVLIVSLLVLRFNAWAFIGGFLISLAIEFSNRGAEKELQIVVLIMLVGSIIQIGAAVLDRRFGYLRSSVGQNAVFALVGASLAYALQFITCTPSLSGVNFSNANLVFARLMGCRLQSSLALLTQANHSSETAELNAMVQIILLSLLLWPVTWAALFAALRQVGLKPGRIISQAFKASCGIAILGIPTYFCLLTLSLAAIMVPDQYNPIKGNWLLIAIAIDLFLGSLGAGWGASWGVKS